MDLKKSSAAALAVAASALISGCAGSAIVPNGQENQSSSARAPKTANAALEASQRFGVKVEFAPAAPYDDTPGKTFSIVKPLLRDSTPKSNRDLHDGLRACCRLSPDVSV